MSLKVLKIGTSLLKGNERTSTAEVIGTFSQCISEGIDKGDRFVLVTSGAVGLGCQCIGIKKPPVDVVSLQAVAAIGQGQLMALYDQSMRKFHRRVAQVLLTRSDFGSRSRYNNASNTLKKLLDWGVLPVVNENDALSPEELRYGDNDTLSALVASALEADQLILLTDIDHLYSSDPRMDKEAKPIRDIHNAKELNSLISISGAGQGGMWGTGGMSTKLDAARIATTSGIEVHLADGRDPKTLKDLLNGCRGGTVFHANPKPIGNRKSWLAHALRPVGAIQLDQGACNALNHRGASLLLVGVKKVVGQFEANEPVKILTPEGEELARGLSSFSSQGLKTALESITSSGASPIVIHRDVLVLTKGQFS